MADPVTVVIAPAENDDSDQNQGNEAVQSNRSRLSRFVDFVERVIRSPYVIIPSKVRIAQEPRNRTNLRPLNRTTYCWNFINNTTTGTTV